MMIALLFILMAQESTAVVMPGDAPMERGPALGKLLVDYPGFLLINFTLGTQLLNLSPDPTPIILLEHKEISGVFSDMSEDEFHRARSPFISPDCFGDTGHKLQLDGNESHQWNNLERSFGFSLFDAFIMVPKLTQGAHPKTVKIPNIGALDTSIVGGQAPLSNKKRQLRGGRSTPNKTTVLVTLFSDFLSHICHDPLMINTQQPDWLRYEGAPDLQLVLYALGGARIPSSLMAPERIQPRGTPGEIGLSSVQAEVAQGIEFAFTVHIHVKKMESKLLFSFPHVTIQDIHSPKWLPSMSYRLGNIDVEFYSTPLLAYQESVVPPYWLPESHAPHTVSMKYHLHLGWPQLRDTVKKHGSMARIENVHLQRAPKTCSTLLNRCSVNVTLLCNMNTVQVLPSDCFLSLRKPIWYPSDPEVSQGPAKYLYLFCGHKPYVYYSILKNPKGRVNSLVLDSYDSRVTRYGLLSPLPWPFYVVFSSFFIIIFVWPLEQWFAVLRNWLEPFPFEDEDIRELRLEGEAIMRYLCRNVIGTY